jgi:hypothetical protein
MAATAADGTGAARALRPGVEALVGEVLAQPQDQVDNLGGVRGR